MLKLNTHYLICVSIKAVNDENWVSVKSVPSFILDASIQGIMDATHAKMIAEDMINDILTIGNADRSTSVSVDVLPLSL